MKNWQICEKECLQYLKKNFADNKYNFEAKGGSDPTKSDILLTKNGIAIFYIESKMNKAQCGQFVAFPNTDTNSFEYSKSNVYSMNIHSAIILDKMAENFNRYKTPGTEGIELSLDKSYFYSWICDFYKNKNVKYFIVEKDVGLNNMSSDNFIIFPIEHFQNYFDVTAIYRRKKSGSTNPTENDYLEIKKAIKSEGFSINKIYKEGKYVFIKMSAVSATYKIIGENHTYQFKHIKDDIFKVTRLSNTSNPNIIFSISLIKKQQEIDLTKFKREFN